MCCQVTFVRVIVTAVRRVIRAIEGWGVEKEVSWGDTIVYTNCLDLFEVLINQSKTS